MCMASHIYEYTQQTTHRVATNTTRRPLFHRAPEDEDDRGAHSKAKEFILGISVCCLCFLKLVNLDLDQSTTKISSKFRRNFDEIVKGPSEKWFMAHRHLQFFLGG